MAIVYGADITEDDLKVARTPVINVVAGQQTVGAGCYPVPMYPFVPQVFPSPLPMFWGKPVGPYGTTNGITVGNQYTFHNPARSYPIPYWSRSGKAYPDLPTYWLARPRMATASPLSTPFPLTNMCTPQGPNGGCAVSVSQANAPMVWGVSGPPFVNPLEKVQALITLVKLHNNDLDGALAENGVVDNQPVDVAYNLPLSPYKEKPKGVTLLLTTPRPRRHGAARLAKRYAYILSGLDPRFLKGYNLYSTVGAPIIQGQVQLDNDDYVSLKELAIATGMNLAGVIDPALIDSALMSTTVNNMADKALVQAAQYVVQNGTKKEGIEFSQTPDGSLVVSGNTVGFLGNLLKGITSVVKDVAPAISSAVSAVSSGGLNLSSISSLASDILPAVSTAASAFGASDVAKVAKKLNTTISSGTSKVNEAMNLINTLASRQGVSVDQLGQQIQQRAEEIEREGRAPRELLEDQDIIAQAATITDIERRRTQSQQRQVERPKKKKRSTRSVKYSSRIVKRIINDLAYLSSEPADLIDILEEALDMEVAEDDVVKALRMVLYDRLGYIEQDQGYQPREFRGERSLMNKLGKRLVSAKNQRYAARVLKSLLKYMNRMFGQG